MAVADVYNIKKKKVAKVELNDAVFGAEVNEAIVYDVVKMQLASRRSGTASTKTRHDVSGGGKSLGGKKEQEEPEPEQQDHLFGEAEELFLDLIPAIFLTAYRKRYVEKL